MKLPLAVLIPTSGAQYADLMPLSKSDALGFDVAVPQVFGEQSSGGGSAVTVAGGRPAQVTRPIWLVLLPFFRDLGLVRALLWTLFLRDSR